MGSVTDFVDCPKCKKAGVYARDYYYKSGEEYCTCMHCGYTHNVSLKYDDNNRLVREKSAEYDLNKGNVFYVMKTINYQTKKERIVCEKVMGIHETEQDVLDFIHIRQSKTIPEKFKEFISCVDLKEDEYLSCNLYVKEENEYKQLWYHITELKNNNGILEVWDAVWETEESGGFGMLCLKTEFGSVGYSLKEGDVPEITEDVIFASAVIDGQLIVLKENTYE